MPATSSSRIEASSGKSMLASSQLATPLLSVRDFQQAGGKVAFISLKNPMVREPANFNFDPEEAKLFKTKRFGSNSPVEGQKTQTQHISHRTFGLRDDSVQQTNIIDQNREQSLGTAKASRPS